MSSDPPSLLSLCTQFFVCASIVSLSALANVTSTVRSTWIAGLLPSLILKGCEPSGPALLAFGVVTASPTTAFHLFCRNMNCSVGRQATIMPMQASTMPQYRVIVRLTVVTLAWLCDCR